MRRWLAEQRLFLQEFWRNYHTTGAILPSGPWLARALASNLPRNGQAHNGEPKRVLEVGPGTGAVTAEIVARLGPEDRLDLVELNEAFVEGLRRRFERDAAFRAVAPRSRVLHCPVEDLPADTRYDAIISGLPLNNFTAAQVQRLLDVMTGLLAPQGTLSFFEYIGIRVLKGAISRRAERERLREIAACLNRLLEAGEFRRDWVWPNVPPAWVHHVRGEGRGP